MGEDILHGLDHVTILSTGDWRYHLKYMKKLQQR